MQIYPGLVNKWRRRDSAARAGEQLLTDLLGEFKLGDRDLQGVASFAELRAGLDPAIESLR